MNSLPLKILIVTGEHAYPILKSIDWDLVKEKYSITLKSCPVSVVAFLSPRMLSECLGTIPLEDFDIVMISGLIPWDPSRIPENNQKNMPKIVKGPAFASQILPLLQSIEPYSLLEGNWTNIDVEIFGEAKYQKFLSSTRNSVQSRNSSQWFTLNPPFTQVIFSPNLPPVVLGEVVGFPSLSDSDLFEKIEILRHHGAQIIDLGCIPNEDHQQRISEILPVLIQKYAVPFSIDSTNPQEIEIAVKHGISMVLSITPDNFEQLKHLPKNIPIVLIVPPNPSKQGADDISEGYQNNLNLNQPYSPHVTQLLEFYEQVRSVGFQKIFLDPILHSPISPGLFTSLQHYGELRSYISILSNSTENNLSEGKSSNNIPPQLFMGISNVTELVDGDSPGITTILAALANELEVGAVLLTEHSSKCFQTIEEFQNSARLMFLAQSQNQPPINIGLTAFKFKSKRIYDQIPPKIYAFSKVQLVPEESVEAEMDPAGFFKIYLSVENKSIYVSHYRNSDFSGNQPTQVFRGTNAESIYKQILAQNLVSRLDHAAYLGKELQLAEWAFKMGTDYHQN
ncbi:MAG: DUF4346 domain-containing protein [Promethearchaeota archaeon]